jgi:DNA-binding CsgD family transcriptional regulator
MRFRGASMSDTLVLQCVSAPFVTFPLASHLHILGRSPRCDVVVNHPSISRRHAEVRVHEAGASVSDLASTNGTFVGNKRVQTSPVAVGQVVRFGSVSFFLAARDPVQEPLEEPETDNKGTACPAVELLSNGQHRVFDLLLSGQPEKTIALRLDLSPHTVHNHIRAIFRSFQVHSRAELLARVFGQTEGVR